VSGCEGLSYRDAGVDLEAAGRAKERLRELVARTRDADTLSEMGLFGGLYAVPEGVASPVLVSSADGVGTKLKVAFRAGRHDTVGHDLVNHCVDDILCQGARPLFFLDYLATGAMEEGVVEEVVGGVAQGCLENRCALLGGETAEMPGFYAQDEYDLAGFVVGLVERDRILDGSTVGPGDLLVALASSGLHTNGYTLARTIVFERMGLGVDDRFPGTDETVGEALLRVHRSYLAALTPALDDGRIHALAHVTGGGIPGNLPRALPDGLGAVVDLSTWEAPPIFRTLQEAGGVSEEEMLRVFNMGVGMIAVLTAERAESLVEELKGRDQEAWILGRIEEGEGVRFVGGEA